jgi:hypothetical protein
MTYPTQLLQMTSRAAGNIDLIARSNLIDADPKAPRVTEQTFRDRMRSKTM